MNIFFGTDGWRAHLGSEINEDTIAVTAQAFADYLNIESNNSCVAIGYDTRLASNTFAKVFSEVLSANGISVLLSDKIIPTPVLSYAVKNNNCIAGVMITASHNPPEYNGVKFKGKAGGPFSSEDTKDVEKLLFKNPIKRSSENVKTVSFLPEYIFHLKKLIDFNAIREAQLPLLVDSMGGAGLHLIENILKEKGCKVETIYGTPSQNFHERLAEPIEKNLQPLIQKLHEGGFALGVATDGDADRLGVCLNNGKWLSAQKTILLLVDYIKRVKKIPGGIVKTSSVTDRIRTNFESSDIPVYEVQVGFKYIADIMMSENIAFGGEESGGFGYGMHLPERDGILSALLMLEMLSVSKHKTLEEYVNERIKVLGEVYYDRIDFHYDKSDKNNLLPQLYSEKRNISETFNIVDVKTYCSSRGVINGLKFIFEGDCRWLLIRSSETEDIIRFYAEGQSNNEVQSLLNSGINAIVK